LIVDSASGRKGPGKLSIIVLIFGSQFGKIRPKLSMIVLTIDSGFGGKLPKLSMVLLIVDSALLEMGLIYQ